MSKRRSKRKGLGPLPHVTVMLAGAGLTGAAWFYLVGAAIDFGVLAVDGQGQAWLFTIAASLGAVVCLVLVMALGARALRTLGVIREYKPKRAAAKRKAEPAQAGKRSGKRVASPVAEPAHELQA